MRISRRLVEDAPDILQNQQIHSFMDGIANLEKRMIMMLNLENILVEKEWKKLEDMNPAEKAKQSKTPRLKKQGRGEKNDKGTDS